MIIGEIIDSNLKMIKNLITFILKINQKMRFTSFAPASADTIYKFNQPKYPTVDQNVWSGFILDDVMTRKIEKSLISVEKLFYPSLEITKKTKLTKREKQKEKNKMNKKNKKFVR